MTYDEDAAEEAVAREVYHEDGPAGAARDYLLERHATLRADLDELLDVARAAGRVLDATTVNDLYLRLATLGEDLAHARRLVAQHNLTLEEEP